MWPGGTSPCLSPSHDVCYCQVEMSGPRISIKYHFGIVDSHTRRKRYGQVAKINFG